MLLKEMVEITEEGFEIVGVLGEVFLLKSNISTFEVRFKQGREETLVRKPFATYEEAKREFFNRSNATLTIPIKMGLLQASACGDTDCPGIAIDLLTDDGELHGMAAAEHPVENDFPRVLVWENTSDDDITHAITIEV